MNKYQINGSEFYEHFAQYDTWLETLGHLVEHEHIRRKKAKGRDFFRNVSNDIIDGLVISKKCAASLLQDMSAALIQPPKSYDGDKIVPSPKDLELLRKLSVVKKTNWKRRIGNRTRKPLEKKVGRQSAHARQGVGRQSAGVRQALGRGPVDARQVLGIDWGTENIKENANSDGRYFTLLNPTLLNYTQQDLEKDIGASRGVVSSTQELDASQSSGGSQEVKEVGIATGIPKEVLLAEESHLGMRLNPGAIANANNIHYLNAGPKPADDLDVNNPARIGEPNSIALDDGFIVRVKNKTSGSANGKLMITLNSKADNAVYTSYLSGTDDRPFGPNRTRSSHLNKFAKLAEELIADGHGAPGQSQGQILLGQFKRWSEKSKSLVSLADHHTVFWMHPNRTTMALFLVLGDRCHSTQLKLSRTYGSDKNPDLLAAAGNRPPLMARPYSDKLFYEFLESVAEVQERLPNVAANG